MIILKSREINITKIVIIIIKKKLITKKYHNIITHPNLSMSSAITSGWVSFVNNMTFIYLFRFLVLVFF